MKSIITKVSESEIKKDNQDRYYKTVTFEKINDDSMHHPILQFISIVGMVKRRKLRCYRDSFNDIPDPGFLEPIGTHFFGDIISREVEPYDIVDSSGKVTTVKKYSVIVFGDSESETFKLDIARAFENSGHILKSKDKDDPNITIAK